VYRASDSVWYMLTKLATCIKSNHFQSVLRISGYLSDDTEVPCYDQVHTWYNACGSSASYTHMAHAMSVCDRR